MRKIRTSKLVDLKEAVDMVKEGARLATGGQSLANKPSAFVREIVKKGIGSLVLFSNPIASYDADLLIGAGLVKKTYLACVTFDYLGLAPNFRKAAENGEIEVIEVDARTVGGGYMAAVEGLPVHPLSSLKGTDLLKTTELIRKYTAPDGEELTAVVALIPDVAVIHVPQADEYGNARYLGPSAFDIIMIRASKKVIVTADEIVSLRTIEADPSETTVPSYWVDAVVEVPFGAHPCSCNTLYDHDEEHLREYIRCAELARRGEAPNAFSDYLKKYVYQPDSIYDYLELVGGPRKMIELRRGVRR